MIKNLLVSITIITMSAFAFAQTAEEMQQKQIELTYKVACLSDAEVSVDAELLQIVGSNPDVVTIRENFQAFVASPKAAFEKAVEDYKTLLEQEKAALEQAVAANPQVAEAIKKAAEEYAAQNKVSIEEATAKVMEYYVAYGVQQKTGIANTESLVFSTAVSACGLSNYIQPIIVKSGCKTMAGAVVDMTATNQFCQSIATDMTTLTNKSAELAQIDAATKATIAKVTTALELASKAQMAPISESMNEPMQKIVDAALNLIGTPAPVEIPAKP